MTTVARIAYTPVRTFALDDVEQVLLGPDGPADNRRFMLVDGAGERLRSSSTTWPTAIRARYDVGSETLRVVLPGGDAYEGSAAGGEQVTPAVGDRRVPARLVRGPWEPALSELAGHPVRIARPDDPRDAYALRMPVTLVSDGSLRALAGAAGADVDPRRFRMLLELAGCEPHEEDRWEGRTVQLGEAVLRVGDGVARCAVTTRDPDTGQRDLDTLHLIRSYRGRRPADGAIVFGVYADVVRPGLVRVGDSLALL